MTCACGAPLLGRHAKQCRACYRGQGRHCIECSGPLSRGRTYCRSCWLQLHPTKPTPNPKPWDVDEMAVERLRRGYPVHSNPAERRQAAAALLRLGLSTPQMAERLKVSERTAERYRQYARTA